LYFCAVSGEGSSHTDKLSGVLLYLWFTGVYFFTFKFWYPAKNLSALLDNGFYALPFILLKLFSVH